MWKSRQFLPAQMCLRYKRWNQYVLDQLSGARLFAQAASENSAVVLRIATTLRCGLRIPRGPSCGTSAENRVFIVRCCNPTQWHRAQIKGCWAECALCVHTHKQCALQRTYRARQASGSLQFRLSWKVKITGSTQCTSTPVLHSSVCSLNGF